MTTLLGGQPLVPGGFDVDDGALWTGAGVFETLRTVTTASGRRVLCLDDHLDRLASSAAFFGWAWDRAATERELRGLAATEPSGDLKLNVLLTESQRLLRALPLDLARIGAPARCATMPVAPIPWLPGHVKHTSRVGWLLAVRQASRTLGEPVDEVIWRDEAGCWTEANRSNLIAIRGGELWTAPLDGRILAGVTRARVLAAARSLGVTVHEEAPSAAELWDELYLCSTLKELAPVVRLDGRDGPGPGPVGESVRAAMQ